MRTRTVAATVLALALAAAGCARNGTNDPQVASARTGPATASASPSSTPSQDPDAGVKYAQCMRAHGMTSFPDPKSGQLSFFVPKGEQAKFDAAQQACRQYAPNGGQPPKPSAQQLEQVRQMAKCMRANGIPNFPDPKPDGQLSIDGSKIGVSPDSPTWKKAEAACAKYRPDGAVTSQGHVDGGGAGLTTGGGGNG